VAYDASATIVVDLQTVALELEPRFAIVEFLEETAVGACVAVAAVAAVAVAVVAAAAVVARIGIVVESVEADQAAAAQLFLPCQALSPPAASQLLAEDDAFVHAAFDFVRAVSVLAAPVDPVELVPFVGCVAFGFGTVGRSCLGDAAASVLGLRSCVMAASLQASVVAVKSRSKRTQDAVSCQHIHTYIRTHTQGIISI
jgi:hypothetical protein